ncbi:MAG TPA: hypothetical protein VFK31_06340 [Rhodanobacteraceae bacterium]|nr:hypothetical protein [Rhodanobacteraceae bacterium]
MASFLVMWKAACAALRPLPDKRAESLALPADKTPLRVIFGQMIVESLYAHFD